jgi:hypothetical protein
LKSSSEAWTFGISSNFLTNLEGDGLDDFLWEVTIATKVATSGEEEEGGWLVAKGGGENGVLGF